MPLDKPTLKQTIRTLLDNLVAQEDDAEAAREAFAVQLSDAIDVFIRSGKVTVNVTTTGSATTQSGGGTGAVT